MLQISALLTITACNSSRTSVESYTNPLKVSGPSNSVVENCPDPAIIRGQKEKDESWYLYCTSDPLNDQDKNAAGEYNEHLIPTLKSDNLVDWTYVNNAFTQKPDWAADDAELWAPEIEFFNDKYHLYYTVTKTKTGGSAIGVAVSDSPTGPWTHAAQPVVEPHEAPCCGGSKRWNYDPSVLIDGGRKYIYYGSYFGGVSVRALSDDGLTSDPFSQVEVTVANRYEAADVVKRGEFYYLLASSSDCCNGPLTGYSVWAGRSRSPFGPFVDRDGVLLTTNRPGGTRVIGNNGNRWVGPGHSTILTDFGGRDWLVYHAVDRNEPYFAQAASETNLRTKRRALIDPLDWIEGWPTVRGGQWASEGAQPAPAAKPGEESSYRRVLAKDDVAGDLLPEYSDDFDGTSLGSRWTWVRQPSASTFGLEDGAFRFDTQSTDLFEGINSASVVHQQAPTGNYVVETKLSLDLPPAACCHNFTQAGLVIYADDDSYLKLVHFSFWETRQTAFAKEVPMSKPGYARYGETLVGKAAEVLWLRIVKRTQGAEEHYTAYSSHDGKTWEKGGTWTHNLGQNARIGLVSMSKSGFTARFDYVRVYTLRD